LFLIDLTLFLCYLQPSEASTIADSGVEDIEKRIQALEVGEKYDATKSEVQKVEQEFLLKLREIRAAITAEAQAGGSAGGVSSSAGGAGAPKELEALRAENELLKKKNAKLEYRLQHVVNELMVVHDKHNHLVKKTGDIVDSRASF
jgi:predicted  nucleic acid-binding Zn-ribbon protein